MPTCLARGSEIAFTLMRYTLDTPIQDALKNHRSDSVLGFVTYNKETGKRRFTYTESGVAVDATKHWSLKLLKEFPYLESQCSWIVYMCEPEAIRSHFNDLLHVGLALFIHNWDIWTVEEKEGSVAVITNYEIY